MSTNDPSRCINWNRGPESGGKPCDSGCFSTTNYYQDAPKRIAALELRLQQTRLPLLQHDRIPKARAAMEKLWDQWTREDRS